MGTRTLARKALLSRASSRLKSCFGTEATGIPETIQQASNAFITRLDPLLAASDPVEHPDPELAGLTVAIKDIFCTRGSVTNCASAALEDFKPPYDAHVVSQLRRHGARIVGKTNMDEFSMGSASTFSQHGPVVNPHGFCPERQAMIESRSAGGSSGGSAAAVAAGLCDIGIGSDTGGSIRLPAAHCGLLGLKPSYGLISRFGMIQYSTSLDTVGILARSADHIRKTFSCLNGFDRRDLTSIPVKYRLKSNELNRLWQARFAQESGDLSNIRVGVPIEYFTSDISDDVLSAFRATVDFLKERGAQFVSISLPSTANCLGAYYVIASAEASSNLARYSGLHYGRRSLVDRPSRTHSLSVARNLYSTTRTESLGDEVKRRLLLGTYALSASGMKNYFIQAQKVRLQVRTEFERTFRMPNVLSTAGAKTSYSYPLAWPAFLQ
ncbi:hypothetical protein PtB15_6B299 [Puccinia triticina]|nr:hypothetical protein PtB15_6B299 [Puccinia triticina]